MAAAPSSSADPAAAPPPSVSSNPPPPRTYISSMNSPILPLPSHFSSQSILGRPPNPPPPAPQSLLYPIVPGTRPFPPRSSAARGNAGERHVVAVANPAGYIRSNCPTTVLTFPAAAAVQGRPLNLPADQAAQQMYHHQRHQRQQQGSTQQMRQLQQLQAAAAQMALTRPVGQGVESASLVPDSAPLAASVAAAAPSMGAAAAIHPKVTAFQAVTSNSEFSNFKELREKNREDGAFLVNGRKVRISESPSGSLYTLCRSWVRNGWSQEVQPNFGDGIRLLPRPLPLKVAEHEHDEPTEEEDVDSVDNLSPGDLLKRHIKRAKRVRARLTEERLQRIERYKQRLSLLLPLPIDQIRSEAAPGG